MAEIFDHIPENIKRIRTQKGITQDELAERCYCSRVAISNLETGKKIASLNDITKVAEALDVSCLDLIFSSLEELGEACSAMIPNAQSNDAERLVAICAELLKNETIEDSIKPFLPHDQQGGYNNV